MAHCSHESGPWCLPPPSTGWHGSCFTGRVRRLAAERKTSRSSGVPGPADGDATASSPALASFDVTSRLAEIRIPALVIHGAKDRIVPAASAQRLADGIAGARRVVFPDAGHVYTTDAPDAANQEVLRFLADVPDRHRQWPGSQPGSRSRNERSGDMTGPLRPAAFPRGGVHSWWFCAERRMAGVGPEPAAE